MVKINCKILQHGQSFELEVGSKWTLTSIRQEVIIALGYDSPEEFNMYIAEEGHIPEKASKY